ncbi:MAG: hypothetical protein ACOCT9_01350, partial [archaeon]
VYITYIMDLVVDKFSNEFAEYLISRCTKKAIEDKTDMISSMVSTSSNLKDTYKRLGYISISPKKLPEDIHFGVRRNTNSIKTNILFDPDIWHISLTDTPGL